MNYKCSRCYRMFETERLRQAHVVRDHGYDATVSTDGDSSLLSEVATIAVAESLLDSGGSFNADPVSSSDLGADISSGADSFGGGGDFGGGGAGGDF